jgi:hypothetical protein
MAFPLWTRKAKEEIFRDAVVVLKKMTFEKINGKKRLINYAPNSAKN